MPRRGRGGARAGKPGVAHGQRVDLNRPKVPAADFEGQAYGVDAEQQRTQQATAQVRQQQAAGQVVPAPRDHPGPGQLGDLLSPTVRPDEPLTAGLPIGPGPGPSPSTPTGNRDVDVLRAAYKAYPSTILLRLIAAMEDE